MCPFEKCPHARRRYYEDLDTCDIVDKICLLETGLECTEWQEIQAEWAAEDNSA